MNIIVDNKDENDLCSISDSINIDSNTNYGRKEKKFSLLALFGNSEKFSTRAGSDSSIPRQL